MIIKSRRIFPMIIAMLTMFIFMASQVTIRADDGSGSLTVTDEPNFVLYDNPSYVLEAGEELDITVTVKNVSDTDCDVVATITDENNIFNFESGNVYSTDADDHSTTNLEYTISTPAYTPAGRYSLKIDLISTYEDDDDNDLTTAPQTLTIYVDVESDVKTEALDVIDYSTDIATVKTGDIFNIRAKVKNNTGLDLTDVKFSLDGLNGDKFAMNSGLASKTLDLKKNAETILQFQLIACDGIAYVREVIPLKISYLINPNDAESVKDLTTGLTVSCVVPEETTKPKVFAPNIIIDKYSFGGDYVIGGKVFPLALTIRNTSSSATIQNLKVTIQGATGETSEDTGVAFSPANSSNSFFYDSLGGNASKDLSIDFLPKADAVPNSYPIEVIFDYEYTVNGKKGDEKASVTQTITIPLQQEDRFSANPAEIEPNAFVGQECPLSVTLVNKGKSSVYNVSVDIEGEGFDKTSSSYFIGNVESGKEEYYDARIIPNTEGEIKGEIVITYEDSNGSKKEIREEFITTAMQMMMPEDAMKGGMIDGKGDMPVDADINGTKKSPVVLIIIIAGGVIVLGAAAFVILRIRKKKKLKAQEIEDDDEDI